MISIKDLIGDITVERNRLGWLLVQGNDVILFTESGKDELYKLIVEDYGNAMEENLNG